MPIVQMPKRAMPRQVEFGPDVERSKPGALYFVPGAIKSITDDEFDWIKENNKQLFSVLVVVSKSKIKSKLAIEREKSVKKTPIVARPKDKMSKAKQRALDILEGKNKPQKEVQTETKPSIKQKKKEK